MPKRSATNTPDKLSIPPRRASVSNSDAIDRRTFLSRSAATIAGTALTNTALSYGKVLGANDRISLCHVGIGGRGTELDMIGSKVAASHRVEMNAVCDLWSVIREKAVATNRPH